MLLPLDRPAIVFDSGVQEWRGVTALLLLYSLVATGQITLRVDGHEKMTAVIRARVTPRIRRGRGHDH